MRKRLITLTTLLGLLALAGCVNLKPSPSQTESYILGPVNPVAESSAAKIVEPIYILRPQVPTYQDGSRMTYRKESGEVEDMPGIRWAEPLAEGIARAVSLYLSSPKVSYYPWPNATEEASRLSVNFQRFGATESGAVQVVAHWNLKRFGGQSLSGQFTSESLQWTPGQPETLVSAYNEALRKLALDIANRL